MQRRQFFKTAGAVTAAAATVGITSKAFANDAETIEFQADITSNHGHDLQLDIVQVVELMGLTAQKTVSLDIQGQSGHPHSIELDQASLVELLSQKSLSIESSEDFGHSHGVNIELMINS